MTSLGITRIAPRPRASTDPAAMVPSSLTPLQWFDAADLPWVRDVYLPLLGRRSAVSYPIVHRCVSLLGGIVSRLVTDTVHVLDRDRRRVRTAAADALVDTLRESIDGVAPAGQTIEDVVADYALAGNSFLLPVRGSGRILRFDRLGSPDVSQSAVLSRLGTWVYQLSPVRSLGGVLQADERELVHVRWPRMGWSGSASARDAWAEAPVTVLRPAVAAGIEFDAYVIDWLRRARRSHLHFDFEISDLRPDITDVQQREIRKRLEESLRAGGVLITAGAKSNTVTDAPDEKWAAPGRDFQLADVARFYGLPAPLIGLNLTSWGSGIEELSRIAWRFGVSQHVARFLAPFSSRCLPRGQRLAVNPHWLVQGDSRAMRELILALDDPQRDPLATRAELREMAGLLTLDQADLDSLTRHARAAATAADPADDPAEPAPEPGPGPDGPGPDG